MVTEVGRKGAQKAQKINGVGWGGWVRARRPVCSARKRARNATGASRPQRVEGETDAREWAADGSERRPYRLFLGG